MKVVQINSVCETGSTGKICVALSELLTEKGIENYIFYALGNSSYPLGKKYMSSTESKLQALKSKIFGNYGFQSKSATKRLVEQLERISPDIVHLHNLHSHNVHLDILFSYLKKKKIKIFWTFHDCWAFTAYCPYYDMAECDQWKRGCVKCPLRKHYSWLSDRSNYLFKKKKELFSDLDLTIITPSQWLAEQVKQSFLKEYKVEVINNGIDLNIFKPIESDFRAKYGISNDKFIILGVAFGWGKRKGLDVFIELSKRLDPERFQIVLVGTDDNINKQLPENIISIHRTGNQQELAEIYTAADLFVNPTREEVLGLVNIESLACGTPVVTFKTGGSPECIDETCGCVVEKNDVESLVDTVISVCVHSKYSSEACVAKVQNFEVNNKFKEYVSFYFNNN